MDEQVINDLYNKALRNGYMKSKEDFVQLLHTDDDVLNDMYSYVKQKGYAKDINSFSNLVGKTGVAAVDVKKKEQSATTELPVADSSSASQSQPKSNDQPQQEEEGFLSKAKKALQKGVEWNYASLAGVGERLLTFYDDAINATKAALGGAEENPLTPQQQKEKAFKEKFGIKDIGSASPFDPRVILSNAGNLASIIINSTIPQEQKNKLIQRLNLASNTVKIDIERLKDYKEKHLPDNLLVQTAQNILEMAPDLVLAGAMENPQIAESKFAQTTEKIASKLSPYFKKNVPKAAKVLEESIRAPFTKIIAVKEAVKEMGETKQGESSLVNGLEGAAKGALEGMQMHGLGVAAGKVATPISRAISKLGINSAIASSIATPLANAGVFTTARAIRKGVTEGKMITTEEIAQEAAMGVGFSLLHLGSQYKNQNEANHYYDNVLNDDELHSFGRVINETKDNLDLAYNTDLTPEKVQELKDARDEIKKAILREPDMQKKRELGDEAVKIQNQIDAHNNISKIVEDKDILVEYFQQNNQLNAKQKEHIINKIKAIAETYDMSEYAVKAREFNAKITEAQKELDAAGERFTNAKNPVARAEAKNEVDQRRKELEELNNQLTELITKKQEQDAIQKQESDESMLRAGEERLGLRQVGKGNAESQITPEQEQIIADEESFYQEVLDNPESDEQDLQEANAYFENPVAHLENQVKFWEDEVKDNPEDQEALDATKKVLEAHKAALAKPVEDVVTDEEYSKFIDKGVVSQERLNDIAQKVKNREKLSDRENEIFTDKTSEINKIISEAQPEGITIGAGSAIATTGKPTEVTGGEGTETMTSNVNITNKALENESENNPTAVANVASKVFEDAGYHVGNLQDKSDYATQGYHGDMPFTGYYFVSSPEKVVGKESRKSNEKGFKIVDFSKYNLLKLTTPQYWVVKKALKRLSSDLTKDKLTVEESIENNSRGYGYAQMLEYWMPEFLNKIKQTDISSELNKYVEETNKDEYKTDRLETAILKKMGYEGIDVRDAKETSDEASPDSFSEGSVIFDLKEGTVSTPAEAYHKAKADGSNPELVKSVEEIIGEPKPTDVTTGKGTQTKTSGQDIYYKSGKLKGEYIREQLGNALDAMSFRKFGDLYRKHFDKFFTREDNSHKLNGNFTFRELANYIISDEYFDYEDSEAKFRAFAKDAGIEIPEREKSEGEPIEVKAGEGITATTTKGEPTDVTTGKTTETKTAGVEVKSLPDYEKTMGDVEFLVPKSKEYVEKDLKKAKERYRINKTEANKAKLDKAKADYEEYKADVASAKEKAMKGLTESTTYKAADQVQQDALVRELAKKFGERQPAAPSAEKITGKVVDKTTISVLDGIKNQIKSFVRGFKEGKNTVTQARKSIRDFVVKNKDVANLNRKDLLKVIDIINGVKNAEGIDVATEKISKIIDNANKDIIEVSKTKIDKEKMKAELKAAKEGKKSVVDKIKAIKDYFDSVKEYGNLTRKDLSKIMKEIAKVKDEKTLDNAANKINDIIDNAKTDILEISELKMIRDKMRAVKEAKKNLNEKRKLIAAAIDFIQKSGSVNAKKVGKMLKDLSKVNLEDDVKIEKIIEYAEKVFEDSAYDEKLTNANSLRKQISKLSGVKGKDANLVGLAKEFRKIKPSMVEDIDAYNEMANKIKESLRGTKIGNKEEPLQVAEMVKISEADKYIKEQLEAQNEKLREEKLAEMNELYDTDFEGATLEQLLELAKSGKPIDKEKETIIRDAIKKMFDMNSTVIKHIIETGKDPFTGEDLELSEEDKKTIKKFMSIDTNKLSMKEAADAIDSLSNFLQNGSTANMETEVRNYQGKRNVEELIKKKLVAKNLTFYGSEHFGRVYADQVATLPMVFELMFKGVGRSSEFEKMSGITELKNAKTFVQYTSTKMGDEYTKEFYERKANDKDFTDASNVAERGMVADLKRTIPGTPEEQQKEFERNKKLIEESIEELKGGNEKERKLGEIYEQVYDKIAKDSKDINEVISKSDKNNVEAVDWWTNKWSEIYDKLAEVSEKVYNKKLDRDLFFTPKRLSKLFGKEDPMTSEEQEELDKGSMFHNNAGSVYKKETGVLKKVNKDYTSLPKNENGEAKRFVDLSFDRNNANSMYDALMDIHTAGVIRQVESFFKSPELKKVIPSAEDRDILYNSRNNGRVQDFIRAVRNKEIVNSSETEKLLRKLNLWSSLGVSGGLGSVSNIFKQTIPVGMNTIINAGALPDLTYMFGDKADFMNRIGYGVSIRGLESQAQISSINKLVDIASKSTGREALEAVEKLNRFWLDTFLKHPDVFIAKASWITYYEKYLKSKGTEPSTIDYKKHEVDEDAANYAQKMVDRQQNISDTDLQGKLLGSKSSSQRFLTSTLMPFASFRLNQFVRAKSDLATIMSKDPAVTAEDRRTAVKSMAGYATEMLVFKYMSTKISELIGTATNAILGKKESDEDKKKRIDNLKRGQVTGAITDMFSPIPNQIVDLAYAKGANFVLDMAQSTIGKKDEDKYKLMINSKVSDVQSLGTLGIAIGKLQILKEAMQLSKTGEFTDEYGRKKYLSQKDQDAMKSIATISFLNNVGLLPAEANSISRNAIKYAKKDASSKEGGKSEEDTQMDEQMQEQRTLSKEELKQDREMKASVLDELKQNEYEDAKIELMDRKIKEYLMTDEERKKYNEDRKAERFKEKQRLEKLLGKHDSKSDMKRYDPALYEETFGEGSKWYQDHKDEIEVEKMMNEAIKKKKDEAEGYSENKKGKSGFGGSTFGSEFSGSGFGGSTFGNKKNK